VSFKIGERLRTLREERGLSRQDVENATGYSRHYLYKVETERQHPSFKYLTELAKFYGLSMDELFASTDELRKIRLAELAERFPPDVQEYLLQEGSEDYVLLAKELADAEIPPDFIRDMVDLIRARRKRMGGKEEGD